MSEQKMFLEVGWGVNVTQPTKVICSLGLASTDRCFPCAVPTSLGLTHRFYLGLLVSSISIWAVFPPLIYRRVGIAH